MDLNIIVNCVVALILGMLLANMLKNVCGCKNVVEGNLSPAQKVMKKFPMMEHVFSWPLPGSNPENIKIFDKPINDMRPCLLDDTC